VHELGTPLSTIRLIAGDFHKELGKDPHYKEDVSLLLSQTERCRDILASLGSLTETDVSGGDKVPLTLLLEEAAAPARNFGIAIELHKGECEGSEPQMRRSPALSYGLGNLVENAVDFARSKVLLNYSWDPDCLTISIIDDGEGFAPEVADKIGEPYISSRKRRKQADKNKMTGGGMGLGLFIAKTLLERLHIELTFRNSADPNLGAEVKLFWRAPFDEAKPQQFTL